MPVRKNKKNQANLQKMEKARHLKEFSNQVKDIIEKAAGPDIVRCIPQYEIEHLYTVRFHPVRVKAAPGQAIPSHILQFSNNMVTRFFKNAHVPIGVGTLAQLSLYDFFSTAYTLMSYSQRLNDEDYAHAAAVKKALAPLAAILDSPVHEVAWSKYNQFMVTISLFCCDINEYLYAFKFNPHLIERGISKAGLCSDIYRTRLPKVKVLIDEHHRPAWRLGWNLPEPELHLKFISIKSEDIYLPPGNMLDVFIQSHALNRLSERLDGIDGGILHFNIFDSFNILKVCKNKYGLLLFEYAIFGDKAGYFLGEVVDEKIIFKTFLFLTNNGTPEADKLQMATGLMKEDITYLAIDKLSTFLHSDIAGNERVKQLFIDAGCESLFKIDIGLNSSSEGTPTTSKAELIEKYLHLNFSPLNQYGKAELLPARSKIVIL
jgi:hypothetical protein